MTDDVLEPATDNELLVGETPDGGPPAYDAAAVGQVAQRVQIQTVELVGAHFDKEDASPLPSGAVDEATPSVGMHAEWALAENRESLGALVSFSALFESEEETEDFAGPYYVFARFRVLYAVDDPDKSMTHDQVQQFVQWNAVFNVWPYWREYLSSTINRAQLPKFIVPVMGVPRAS